MKSTQSPLRLNELLGASISEMDSSLEATNPAINDAVAGVGEGCHSSKSMISVQDSQPLPVLLQDDGDGHSPCTCNVIAGTEKLVPTAAFNRMRLDNHSA
jgi:hypothetical protein